MFFDDPFDALYVIVIIGGLCLIVLFSLGLITLINNNAILLEHCQENGFEYSFYRDEWNYCFSEGKVVRIQCIENKCHIFEEAAK